MILVDTSLWVEHLRSGVPRLEELLHSDRVVTHPFVIGELLCGNMRPGSDVFRLLGDLHALTVASDSEVVGLIRFRQLHGRGIGYLDAHLLASALLSDVQLWTRDSRLHAVATEAEIAFDE